MCDERWDAAGFIEDMYRRRKFRVIEQHFPDGRVVCTCPELGAWWLERGPGQSAIEFFGLVRDERDWDDEYLFAPRWQKPLWWLLDRIGGW